MWHSHIMWNKEDLRSEKEKTNALHYTVYNNEYAWVSKVRGKGIVRKYNLFF